MSFNLLKTRHVNLVYNVIYGEQIIVHDPLIKYYSTSEFLEIYNELWFCAKIYLYNHSCTKSAKEFLKKNDEELLAYLKINEL